jgi:WD40 repeat protein
LLARLDEQLINGTAQRWVVVTGGPGMGKSALLAAWLARREAAGDTVPHHFIRRAWANWDDPDALVGSLLTQIESRYPIAREREADARLAPAARIAAALLRASEGILLPRGERLVLLIDGLDEYDPRPGSPPGDPLAAFLPYELPPGVSVLCASRPRHPYVDSLATRGVLVQIDLDAQSFAADNAATVRAFWERAARELGVDAAFVAQAVERADGNLEHAAMLYRQLAGTPAEQREVEDIPRGLAALIARAWERIAIDSAVLDGLGILCAARESLTLDDLGRVARWTAVASRQAFVRGAREWLIETRRVGGVSEFRLHHDSIRAHIARAIGSDALAAYHLALAERLASWPASVDATARRYALHHALLHRAEAGAWADAWRVAADVKFLEAKCREVGVHDVETDVARTAARCRLNGDEAYSERFADLARALVRESHWLRVSPEATAALIWNRLRRYGWKVSDLDAQLRMPAAADMLRVRHAATRESPSLVRNLEGHASRVTACTVTPDGQHVVSASEDHTLKVWELASGRELATLQGHTASVTACAVTPDGRHVVSASNDRTLKVWELASGRELTMLQGHTDWLNACAVTPNGRHIISASDDHALKVWELATGRELVTLRGHTASVTACAVSPAGRYVVSASNDHVLKVWELASAHAVATLQGHTSLVTACAMTPDGQYVVSTSYDRTLKVWELASGRERFTLRGHTSWVTACAVTPDGRYVVSGSYDRTLKVWELASGHEWATLHGHTHYVTACAVTPDGRYVVSASHDGTLKVWELASGRAAATLDGHISRVTACAVTPDGRHVVSASDDHTLKIWELESGQERATLHGHASWVTACAVTPDGRRVVSASEDRTLKVWDLASGRELATLQGHSHWVTSCAVTPDGRHVVSASSDQTLKVWELASGRELATFQGHTDWLTACAVTPDGRYVVSASADYTIKVWELASGRAAATLHGHTSTVTECVVTPDGRHLVSASNDQTLKVWELANWRTVATLHGHTSRVTACAVTLDGRHVVSASNDHTLKVWDLATSTCRITQRGDTGYFAVAASATTVVAGDAAGVVWFLDCPPYLASSTSTSATPEPPVAVDLSHAAKETEPAPARPDRHVDRPPTEERVMTREELLSRLSKLRSPQFEQVLYLVRVPDEYLPASTAAQALRAVELMRYIEQQGQLDQLARIVRQVVADSGPTGPDPR